MTLPATSDLRWLRAALVAVVAMGFGVTAHALAGGLLPPLPVMAFTFLGLTTIAGSALGRPAGFARLFLLVAGGQAAVHFVLTATAGHGGTGTVEHRHHGATTSAGGDGPPPLDRAQGGALDQLSVSPDLPLPHQHGSSLRALDHLAADLTGPHLLMTVAHLAAAGGVALWLLAGERALWALIALLGRHVVDRLVALASLAFPVAERVLALPVPLTAYCSTTRMWSACNGPTGRRGPPSSHAALFTLTA